MDELDMFIGRCNLDLLAYKNVIINNLIEQIEQSKLSEKNKEQRIEHIKSIINEITVEDAIIYYLKKRKEEKAKDSNNGSN